MINLKVKIKKVTQTRRNTYLLKKSLESWKHLTQAILLAKVILKKMVHNIF